MSDSGTTILRPVALVSGASRGIGRAIAIALAQEGWDLILTCSRSMNELRETAEAIRHVADPRAIPNIQEIRCDMSDPAAVHDLFQNIDRLDLVVNNAGISWVGLLQDMTCEEWNHIVSVNLSSLFYTSREAIPLFLRRSSILESRLYDNAQLTSGSEAQSGTRASTQTAASSGTPSASGPHPQDESRAFCAGRIINISSVWGNVGASCEVAYSATKGGINAFTKALGKELAPSHIPVNAIACGCVDTVMNDNLSPEEKHSLAEEIPAGRFAAPSEIAAAVVQLAHAPAYLTGQVITVDGGWI